MSDVSEPVRGYHDLGGQAAGPLDQTQHDPALWEKRVDALLTLLEDRQPPLIGDDELRRGIESLGADAYDRLSYYERWIASITQILLERGVFSVDELGRKLATVQAREAQSP